MKTLALLLVLGLARLEASDIACVGGWSPTLSATDLTAGAGTNVPSSVSSAAGVTTMALANTSLSLVYHVYAHVATTTWPPGSTLWIRRTSDGTSLLGLSTIAGGTSYLALTSVDQEVFIGLLDRSGITFQYKVDGLSLTVPAATYSATVVFSVSP